MKGNYQRKMHVKTVFDECDECPNISFNMDESSTIPLAPKGRTNNNSNVSNNEDSVDGIAFSRLPVTNDRQTTNEGKWMELKRDGSSRLTTDSADELASTETIPPLFLAIQIGDTCSIRKLLSQSPDLVNYASYRGFPPLHHACNVKNIQALKEILQHGANICGYDALGNTPLHLAVNEAWHEGIVTLLNNGASPDVKCEPSTSVREVRLMTPFHAAVKNGDVISTNILLEHQPDLTITDSNNSSVLHLAARARSLDIVTLLVKRKECQELMLHGDCNGNNVLHSALRKECEPEVKSTVHEIIKAFAEAGANLDGINLQGETPLFLAARFRLTKVVELLLSLGADPTLVTRRGQTLLHAACYSGCASSLSHILNTGVLKNYVTRSDNEGREPFHYAVRSSSIDCCELLLNNGDHLTREDKNGMSRYSLILNHMPSATQLLERLFDAHVCLAKTTKHDPDFCISFDYSVLLSPDDHDVQSSLTSELTSSRLEHLLKHPLLESFLYYKWQKIKTFFYLSVFIYFLYLIIHTTFIILTFGYMQMKWCEHQGSLWIFITLHICMYFLILIPDIIIWFANFKKYLRHHETYSKLIALLSSALVMFACAVPIKSCSEMGFQSILQNGTDNETNLNATGSAIRFTDQTFTIENDTQSSTLNVANISMVRYAAAVSAFFSWIEFMMLLGRFPSLGAYVLMFTRVAKSIIKFMLAFSSLLIAFALSFMVLFYNSPTFKNFPLSLIKTLMMMIGEIEYGDFLNEAKMPTITLLSLVLFLFLVCIVMANLLIGLAVNDIPDLQRLGKIRRLAKQAAYLVSYEKIIAIAKGLRCFPSTLRILMASRCKIFKEVSIYPNRECKARKYKECLPPETVQEAILLGSRKDSKEDFTVMEDEDIRILLKSFRMKYNQDCLALTKKLAEISDNTSVNTLLNEHLNHINQTLDTRLMQTSLQIQQQLQQNQKAINLWMQLQQSENQDKGMHDPQSVSKLL